MSDDHERWDGDKTLRVRSTPSGTKETKGTQETPGQNAQRGGPISGAHDLPPEWDKDPTVVAGKLVSAPPTRAPASDPALKALLTGLVVPTSPSPRPAAPSELPESKQARSVHEQMFVLLGGRAFANREPSQVGRTQMRLRRHGRSPNFWRYGVAALFTILGVFVVLFVGYGLRERARRNVDELSAQLEGVSNSGALGDAETLVRQIENLEEQTPEQLRLIARTEALLYRFRDGAPRRLEEVTPRLEEFPPEHSDEAIVVRGLIASRADRITLLPDLKRIAENSEDPEPSFLVATALSRAGSAKAAVKYFEQSLDIEPSHLEHLAAYTSHQIDDDKLNEAENLLAIMREVSPTSHWTRLAATRLNRAQKTDRHAIEVAEDPVAVPVAESQILLFEAIHRHASGDPKAIEDVQLAMKKIHNGQAFLIDFIDRLLAASWPDAARFVARDGGISGKTPGSAAALGRLVLAEGHPARAADELAQISNDGFVEPVSGRAYLEALEASDADPATKVYAAQQLADAWPERTDLVTNEAEPTKKKKRKRGKRKKRRRRRRRR